jgi:hypothetical protein
VHEQRIKVGRRQKSALSLDFAIERAALLDCGTSNMAGRTIKGEGKKRDDLLPYTLLNPPHTTVGIMHHRKHTTGVQNHLARQKPIANPH